MSKKDDEKALPTQTGTMTAWSPQYLHLHYDSVNEPPRHEWRQIPTKKSHHGEGVVEQTLTGPARFLGFMGYEEAHAIAWQFLADAEENIRYGGYVPKVRVVPYRIQYDVKCYIQEDESIEIN